jgi:hypothetical protein
LIRFWRGGSDGFSRRIHITFKTPVSHFTSELNPASMVPISLPAALKPNAGIPAMPDGTLPENLNQDFLNRRIDRAFECPLRKACHGGAPAPN